MNKQPLLEGDKVIVVVEQETGFPLKTIGTVKMILDHNEYSVEAKYEGETISLVQPRSTLELYESDIHGPDTSLDDGGYVKRTYTKHKLRCEECGKKGLTAKGLAIHMGRVHKVREEGDTIQDKAERLIEAMEDHNDDFFVSEITRTNHSFRVIRTQVFDLSFYGTYEECEEKAKYTLSPNRVDTLLKIERTTDKIIYKGESTNN